MNYAEAREMVRSAVNGCGARTGDRSVLVAALRRDLLGHGVDPGSAEQTRGVFVGAAVALGAMTANFGLAGAVTHGALHLLDALGEIADGAEG